MTLVFAGPIFAAEPADKQQQEVAPCVQLDRRLVNVGEPITFTLTIGAAASDDVNLTVFPRYLESCDPQKARNSKEPLAWLDANSSRKAFDPNFKNGRAELEFTPDKPGNYMARFRSGKKTLYRYFAAVSDEYLVYRMEAYLQLGLAEHRPQLRNGGFPIDWVIGAKLSVDQLKRLLEYQEVYGDLALPGFYGAAKSLVQKQGAPALRKHVEETVERMRKAGLKIGRAVNDWSALQESVAEYEHAGFDVIDGMISQGAQSRGSPWFPYWMSEEDHLSPAEGPSAKLGMIMDFCAGFAFHGPPDFHMGASRCNWQVAAPHADLAAREHVLIASNSGSGPVFVPTLFVWGYPYRPAGWPKPDWPKQQEVEFAQNFLDETAFEHARKYPIAFARCTDIADYMRQHPRPQPRRIYSSKTRDWIYDRFWCPHWCNHGVDVHRDVLPLNDSLADIRKRRPHIWAKPTAREMIYYEDSQHQCRFEYACAKPLLWFEYDDRRRSGKFQGRAEVEVPDPQVAMETKQDEKSFEVRFQLTEGREFPNYKIAVWKISREFAKCQPQTNAKEFMLVENHEGDYRGILVFDLKPEIEVSLLFTRE